MTGDRAEIAPRLEERPSRLPKSVPYRMADELEPPTLEEMRVAIDSVLPPRRAVPWGWIVGVAAALGGAAIAWLLQRQPAAQPVNPPVVPVSSPVAAPSIPPSPTISPPPALSAAATPQLAPSPFAPSPSAGPPPVTTTPALPPPAPRPPRPVVSRPPPTSPGGDIPDPFVNHR